MPAFFTRNQLEAKKRTELQSLAKEHNIKGNLKTEDLVAELHKAMEKQKKSATSATATHTRKVPSTSEAPSTRTRVVSGSSKIPAPAPSTSVSKSAAAPTTTQSVVKWKAKGESKIDDMPPPKRTGRAGRPPSAKPTASTLSRSAASSSRRRKTPASPTSAGESDIDAERGPGERPPRDRVARPSLGTGAVFVEIPPRRASMNVCGIPTSPQTSEGSLAVRLTENEEPILSTSQTDAQPSRHLKQSSITPATIFPFPPTPSTSSTLLDILKASKEFEGIVLDTEASKVAISTLTETLRLEREYRAQLREELDAVKQGKDTALDDVKALREELCELKRIDETSKRESESITESLKVTLQAVETYARGLESRLSKLEAAEEATEDETPAPLNLGKRDRVDTPEKSPEEEDEDVEPSPSGQPSPSKRARTAEPLEDEVSIAQQPVAVSIPEEPASVDISSTAESGPAPATHEEIGMETGTTKTNGINGKSTLLSLGRPSSHPVVNDEPPQSSPITAYFSSLVPPPNYQHPPSPKVPKDSLVPAPLSAGLVQGPIPALPFPLTASKPLAAGGLSSSPSGTSRVSPRKNASSSRHNPIGRKSMRGTSAGGRTYKPVSPANVGNTGAVSFGYSVGSPAAMSTPRSAGSPPDDDGNDESITLTPPKMPAPSFDPFSVPRSNTFRAPSFEFGPQLSNASTTSLTRLPKPTSAPTVDPSPAFSVDNAPRGYDEGVDFSFTDRGLMGLDSPPPPSPSKRTMYGTEIHPPTSQSTSLFGGTTSSSGPFSLFGSIRQGTSSNILGNGSFGGSSTSPGSSSGGLPRAPEPRIAELPPVDEDSGLEKEDDVVFQQTEVASLVDEERPRGTRSNYGLDDPMTWGSPKRSTS